MTELADPHQMKAERAVFTGDEVDVGAERVIPAMEGDTTSRGPILQEDPAALSVCTPSSSTASYRTQTQTGSRRRQTRGGSGKRPLPQLNAWAGPQTNPVTPPPSRDEQTLTEHGTSLPQSARRSQMPSQRRSRQSSPWTMTPTPEITNN